jgi:Lipase (class 3)/PLAT/LH2 domain
MGFDYDPALGVELLQFASDAYYAHAEDSIFAYGYADLDGSVRQFYDRESWLRSNDYHLIYNPAGSTREAQYFGITGLAKDGGLVIAFRGTKTFGDLLIDIGGGSLTSDKYWLDTTAEVVKWRPGSVRGDNQDVLVNKSFLGAYQRFQEYVQQKVRGHFQVPGAKGKLYITGHSLGGALAMICAYDVGTSLSGRQKELGIDVPKPIVYTFGSPRVGDEAFASQVPRYTDAILQVFDRHDPVPQMPNRGVLVEPATPGGRWPGDLIDWYDPGPLPGPGVRQWKGLYPVGVPVPVGDSDGTLLFGVFDHFMTSYYRECLKLLPVKPPDWPKDLTRHDRLESLVVRIKTFNSWFAGTDCDVYLNLLGTLWGPLNSVPLDFETATTSEFDLFARFPQLVRTDWTVGSLQSLGLSLAGRPRLEAAAWRPEWIEITVNKKKAVRIELGQWVYWGQRNNLIMFKLDVP